MNRFLHAFSCLRMSLDECNVGNMPVVTITFDSIDDAYRYKEKLRVECETAMVMRPGGPRPLCDSVNGIPFKIVAVLK